MTDFLLSVATFLMVVVGLGLLRLLRGPSAADRLMAVQMLGTGGAAICALLGIATHSGAVLVVAMTLSLMAAFAVAAFGQPAQPPADTESGDHAG
jgi:multicomponent Na+:H+ antiporter subunit F